MSTTGPGSTATAPAPAPPPAVSADFLKLENMFSLLMKAADRLFTNAARTVANGSILSEANTDDAFATSLYNFEHTCDIVYAKLYATHQALTAVPPSSWFPELDASPAASAANPSAPTVVKHERADAADALKLEAERRAALAAYESFVQKILDRRSSLDAVRDALAARNPEVDAAANPMQLL